MTSDEFMAALAALEKRINDRLDNEKLTRHDSHDRVSAIIGTHDSEIAELKGIAASTQQTLGRMVQLLEGAFGDEGLVKRVAELEAFRREVNQKIYTWSGVAGVLALVAPVILPKLLGG